MIATLGGTNPEPLNQEIRLTLLRIKRLEQTNRKTELRESKKRYKELHQKQCEFMNLFYEAVRPVMSKNVRLSPSENA